MQIEVMPAAPDIERFVLGTVLMDGSRLAELRDAVTLDEFALETHRRIWRLACEQFDSGMIPDRATLAEQLDREHKLEMVGGLSYLVGLSDGIPMLRSLDSYVRTLQEKAFLRRTALAADQLQKRCLLQSDTPASIAEYAHGLLSTLQAPAERADFLTPEEILRAEGIDRILHPQRGIDTISLPWSWLDSTLGGLSREQLVIVGGRTSQGKTSAVCQAVLDACAKGVRTAFFSLEMAKDALLRKFASQMTGLEYNRIKYNHLSREERQQVHQAMANLIEMPLHIADTAARNLATVSAMLRRLRTKYGAIGLVAVDHLHALSDSGRAENRTQQISGDARGLKLLAREFRCPFVVPSQLNNATARDNAKPTLADLRQSGEIAENADVVWFVWLDLNDEAKFQKGEFLIAKQREGYRNVHCRMLFERSTQLWREEA